MARFIGALLLGLLVPTIGAAQEKPRRPNVVFFFSDDQRADTIAALGNKHIKTPHIDKLVARGTAFRRAYCMGAMQGAVCVPSRAMLLTGRSLFKTNDAIKGMTTWPEMFARMGYRTFITGKWHNQPASLLAAFLEGKNVFFGGMGDPHQLPVADITLKRTLTEKKLSGKHSVELFADSAIEFIKQQKKGDKPFVAYVSFNGPHDPRVAPKEYHAIYDQNKPPVPPNFLPQHPFNNGEMTVRDEKLAPWPRTPEVVRQHLADYYAYITFMDAQIGRVLQALREAGLEDDTIIVFASDSGLAVGSHGLFGKQNLYDHSMRAPLIFAGPGIPMGQQSDALVYLFDVFPTLGDLAQVKGPMGSEGQSLVPVMKGTAKGVRDSVFLAYRQLQRAVRDDRWKIIVYPQINKTQLFDLESDPHETKDLASDKDHAKTIQRLTGLLKNWQEKLGDKQPLTSENPLPAEFDFSKVPAEEKKKKAKKDGPKAAAGDDRHAPNSGESPVATAATGDLSASVELYPTYAAVGIEISHKGDSSTGVSFVWRRTGESNWRNGVDMTNDPKRKRTWASIWPLDQGKSIEVKITFDRVDGKPTTWEGKATTRQFNLTPTGRTFFVSPMGDDANPGTREKPFKTLSHGSRQLKSGDMLLALTGIYREGDLFAGMKGTAAEPIVIGAAPGETPVLDSSLVLERGSTWKDQGDGVHAISLPTMAPYVAQDGQRMFPYPTLADLKADKQKARRAWYWDGKAKLLYVRTGTGTNPGVHRYNVAQHLYGAHLTRTEHVVLKGLTFRYYGQAAVRLSEGATGCVLLENTLHNCQGGIFMKSETTRDNAIWRNEIYEVGAADFSWNAHYAIAYGNQAIYCDKAGRGNSFCHNRIHGYFDLIAVESWKNPEKLQYNRDCDIFFNILYNASDDAIEVDGGGVNLRIHGNHIRNCLTAISLAPVERGPVYVTRNHATFLGLFIKFNVGGAPSHGWTYIYHNSAYCLLHGADGGTGISFSPTLPCTNKVLKNNIVLVNEWCVRAWRKDNTLDFNCYYHVPDRAPRRFQAEKKTFNTIADFARAVGQETHGLYADPQFTSPDGIGKHASRPLSAALADYAVLRDEKSGDLRPRPTSPCIDRGVPLRGINDEFRGKAPDIGAFERDPAAP